MRLIALALSAAAVLLVGAACGIDTVSFLAQTPISEGNGLVRAPDSIEPAYQGIDLFYRIYSTDSDAQSAVSGFLNHQASELIPGESVVPYLLSDTQYRFKRIVLMPNSTIPVLPNSSLLSKVAKIDLYSTQDATLSLDAIFHTFFRRNLTTSGISFSTKPEIGDVDFQPATNSDSDPDLFHVQFFAACYGLDIINGTIVEFYSDAVSLGALELSF